MDGRARRVLMLYDTWKTGIGTLQDYLEAFCDHSGAEWWYTHGAQGGRCTIDLGEFDAVAVHYSIRLCFAHWLSDSWAGALQRYDGVKILFIQDEYDNPSRSRDWIRKLGFCDVFTCVPSEYVAKVYPPEMVGPSRFHTVLTGYAKEPATSEVAAPSRRDLLIGYRGRHLPARYGDLARQKLEIGRVVRSACERRGVACDIEWAETARVYGDRWWGFLARCRTMLGTESGSNVFDWDGTLQGRIDRALLWRPRLTYEQIHTRYLADLEGEVRMNQISPKMFEAIGMRTGLVLMEGGYSGVLEPDRHYIVLRSDYSNVDEVIDRVQDGAAVDEMAERAYRDIIEPGRYSWRSFVSLVDERLETAWRESGFRAGERAAAVNRPQDHLIPEERITPRPQVIDWSGRAGTRLGGLVRRFIPFSLRPAVRRAGTPLILALRRLAHRFSSRAGG